jgi:hypothetical protein
MVANIAIILGAMQLGKRIDLEDASILLTVRLVYLVSNIIVFALYAYIYTRIQKKSGTPHTPLLFCSQRALLLIMGRSNGVEVRRLTAALLTGTTALRHHHRPRLRYNTAQERGQGCLHGHWHDGRDAPVLWILATFACAEYYASQDCAREQRCQDSFVWQGACGRVEAALEDGWVVCWR